MSKRLAAWDEAIGGVRQSASFDELQTGGFDELQIDGFDELHNGGFDELQTDGFDELQTGDLMSKRSAAWGNRRWKRSLLERERWESDWGDIQQKKRLGRWESDWERDWERWEMRENSYYFINRSNKKFFFFFSYQLQCTFIYRCAL